MMHANPFTIQVFVDQLTPRVEYTFTTLFKDVYRFKEVNFIDDVELFKSAKGYRLNYSEKLIEGVLQVLPANVLFEETIEPQQIEIEQWKGLPCFFGNASSQIPFDLFAASFYLIARYEEYLPFTKDEHGRFSHENALAFKNQFLEMPIVNLWCEELFTIFKSFEPNFQLPERKYRFETTIDVDVAFAFKNKSIIESVGGLAKTVVNGDVKLLQDRALVLGGKKKDPYDTFEDLFHLHDRYKLKTVYFFLLADKGKYDKNTSYKKKQYQTLIKQTGELGKIGLHPSYRADVNKTILSKEVARLKAITGKKVKRSRQHYIKLLFPTTYLNLIEFGVKHDYTMGYPSHLGFRAGIADNFAFFDLSTNQTTNLIVHPFCAMEATLKYYYKVNPTEGVEHIKKIADQVKKVNGKFSLIWHSDSISDYDQWKGWGHLYEEVIQIGLE